MAEQTPEIDQLRSRVNAALNSDDHTLSCDHWRGDGGCSCLRERVRAALGTPPEGTTR